MNARTAFALLIALPWLGCGGTERVVREPVPVEAPSDTADEPACDTGWEVSRVGEDAVAGAVLALDAEGHPHVVYSRTLGPLVHATRDDGVWSSTVIAERGYRGSIAASAQPWISYYDDSERSLHLARRLADGSWETSEIDAPADGVTKIGVESSLAVSSGTLHVAYYVDRGELGQLRYATRSGSDEWTIAVIDDAVEEISRKPRPHVVVGRGGDVHVVYVGSREEEPPRLRPLLHARSQGDDWQTSVIDQVSSSEIGFSPSLAIDHAGGLHVTYHAHGTFDRDRGFVELRHATGSVNGSWRPESWSWPAHVGGEVPIAVDAGGHPHVLSVGVGGELDRIEHSVGGAESWLRTTVAEGRVSARDIAIAADGAVHAIYIHDRGVAHARRGACPTP